MSPIKSVEAKFIWEFQGLKNHLKTWLCYACLSRQTLTKTNYFQICTPKSSSTTHSAKGTDRTRTVNKKQTHPKTRQHKQIGCSAHPSPVGYFARALISFLSHEKPPAQRDPFAGWRPTFRILERNGNKKAAKETKGILFLKQPSWFVTADIELGFHGFSNSEHHCICHHAGVIPFIHFPWKNLQKINVEKTLKQKD